MTHRELIRRRRAGALLALAAILLLVLGALHGRGTGQGEARARQTQGATPAPRLSTVEAGALVHRAESYAIDRIRAYTPAVVQGGRRGDEVALTFDDGPGPYSLRLLAVLERLHVPATFFEVGSQERWFSAATLAQLRAGDVVGDHTETHPMMARLSAHDQHEELLEQIYRIQALGGPTPRLFRPPYGSFDKTTLHQLHHLHLLMILWSTDTEDYRRPGVETIVRRALAGAHPGAIILMHDAGGDRSQTIAALPAIIRGLRRRGLHPVTVPRLLLDDPPPPGQPIPKSLAGG
ncbi:MAG TPA: polysaccharide deacetylase family protein [Solirubrobacteraceae bacterium]|jgi:peptidoglycan/xylan/chitin deacetylase (PgdA/CDA1 family)|nr:polysaccharide deacetylase family protein [Solirubrobacteraceae bacterium]